LLKVTFDLYIVGDYNNKR